MLAPTLAALIAERARESPGVPALAAPGRAPLAYGELEALVGATRDALRARGVAAATRIALALPDGSEPLLVTLAAACAAQAAPLDPRATELEVEALLARMRAAAILTREADAPAALPAAVRLGLPVLRLRYPAGSWALEIEGELRPPGTAGAEAGAGDTAFALHTSGTTGRSRIVPLTHANVVHAAADGARVLGLGPTDRCLILRSGHHASALVGGLLCTLFAGGTALVVPSLDPRRVFEWIGELRPTWLTAAPAVLRAILDEAARRGIGRAPGSLRFLRSSASPLPAEARSALERLFDAPVVEGYGMSEAPLIASRPPGAAGAAPRPFRPAGPELAVRDGEILVRGPSVMAAYEDDAEANAAAFVDGWFRTGDFGSLDAGGDLELHGRLQDRINRGGEKIAPAQVEELLRTHPGVTDAAVFAAPHARLGEDVAAAVVCRPGVLVTPAALRTFAAERLAPFKVPRRIVFCDAIPADAQGKLSRARLAEAFAPRTPSPRLSARPLPPQEAAIAAIWAEVLGLDHVGVDDDFFELGGDSLAAVAIAERLHERLRLDVPLSIFFEAATVPAFTIRAAGLPLTGYAVVLRAGRGRPPFFFVHGVGGGAFRLMPLAARLGDDRTFVALQAPGLDGTEKPLGSVEALAALYLREVRGRQPRGPYLLGGFCMGGAVAFEMARRLEAEAERVALLALIEPPPLPLGFRRSRRERLAVAAQAAWSRLRRREAGLAIDAREPAVMQANRRALRRYRPGAYSGRATLFLARGGPKGAAEDAEDSIRALARGGVGVHRFEGGHMELVLEPRVAEVAAALGACLKAATGEPA